MAHDIRYTQWLEIADDLKALDEFVYSQGGPFFHRKDNPFGPTGENSSNWIRAKCAQGRWYWWDKTTLAGKAEEPLRTLERVIGDSGGLHEGTENGRAMIEKIERLRARITAALTNGGTNMR